MTDIPYIWDPFEVKRGVPFVLFGGAFLQEATSVINPITKSPDIYRWGFLRSDLLVTAYVGETEDLCRRVRGYFTPGPTQETNKLMHAKFEQAICDGLEIRLEFLKLTPTYLNNVHICNENLGDIFLRKMLENFVLADRILMLSIASLITLFPAS
jgi:hypothetical protein